MLELRSQLRERMLSHSALGLLTKSVPGIPVYCEYTGIPGILTVYRESRYTGDE